MTTPVFIEGDFALFGQQAMVGINRLHDESAFHLSVDLFNLGSLISYRFPLAAIVRLALEHRETIAKEAI